MALWVRWPPCATLAGLAVDGRHGCWHFSAAVLLGMALSATCAACAELSVGLALGRGAADDEATPLQLLRSACRRRTAPSVMLTCVRRLDLKTSSHRMRWPPLPPSLALHRLCTGGVTPAVCSFEAARCGVGHPGTWR